ncbi:MAG: type II toxin-antitoxin system VapB family antitoxin [Colwellia sp.]|nr:type II toxin-antitoxin system VapB family antitoxin [Colwellia sp.]
MRTTVTLDDELIADFAEYYPKLTKTQVIQASLKEFIQKAAARRLAAMGGAAPNLEDAPPRKQF